MRKRRTFHLGIACVSAFLMTVCRASLEAAAEEKEGAGTEAETVRAAAVEEVLFSV